MGEGLRHPVISALAEIMPERALRAHTRHRDGRSLDQYASGAKPDYAAMVARLSPEFPASVFTTSEVRGIKNKNGGGGGNRGPAKLAKRFASKARSRTRDHPALAEPGDT